MQAKRHSTDTSSAAKPSCTAARLPLAQVLRSGIVMLGKGEWQQSSRRLCELLLASILDCRPLDLFVCPERLLDPGEQSEFFKGIRRLSLGEPLQYVTGSVFFMDRRFRSDARALIPRPETEILMQTVLDQENLWRRAYSPVIMDLGTGSGCLAVTLALERPAAYCLAGDRSAAALELARENARLHRVGNRIGFVHGDGLSPVAGGSLDAIITNPPYIPTAAYLCLPRYIRGFEPREALDGGKRGLDIIEEWIRPAADRLRPEGLLFMEIGDSQKESAQRCLKTAGFTDITFFRDVTNRDRVVRARRGL